MMSKPTRILIVEDLVSDFELAQMEIRKSVENCIFKQVDTRPGFLEALETFQPDVILSDYSLPSFDGMSALKLAKQQMPLTPFIIWTGSMSEDIAVECMRAGANNYILKDNLKRLGAAIVYSLSEREILLERKQAEEQLRRSEARFATIFENSPVAIGISRLSDGSIIHVNAAFLNLYGFTLEEVVGRTTAELNIWAKLDDRQRFIQQLRTEKHVRDFESIARLKSGKECYVIVSGELVEIDGEACLMAQVLDITERKRAEEALQESEERYRSLAENFPNGTVTIYNRDLRITFVSGLELSNSGHSKDQFIGKHFKEVAPIETWNTAKPYLEKAFAGEIQTYETTYFDNRHYFVSAAPIHSASGFVDEILVISQDVTGRKQAETALQDTRELFQKTFHFSPVATVLSRNSDRSIIDVNSAAEELFGYTQAEMAGKPTLDFDYWVDHAERQRTYSLLLKQGHIVNQEITFRNKSGQLGRVILSAEIIEQQDEKYILTTFVNITERKQAEIEIQQRNDDLRLINSINEAANRGEDLNSIVKLLSEELKHIFSSTSSTLYMLSPDGSSLTMQQYLLPQEVQRQVEKLIGSSIPLVHIPLRKDGFFQKVLDSRTGFITSDREEIQQWMAEFIDTPFLPSAAKGMIRKLLPQIFAAVNIRSAIVIPLLSDGKAVGILDVASDKLFTENDRKRIENISGQLIAAIQRQQANDRVQRSQEFLQSVQNALSASIAILDENGMIVQVNSAWRKFGEQNGLRHPEDCIGMNYLEICDSAIGANAEEAPLVAKAIRDVISGQRREAEIEYPCHSPEEKRWFTLRITKFDDGEHLWVVLAHENISARKEAEEQLRQNEARLSVIFNRSPIGIVMTRPKDDLIVDTNEAFAALHGYSAKELVGKSAVRMNIWAEPAQREKMEKQLREQGFCKNMEVKSRKKNGEIFDMLISTEMIDIAGEQFTIGLAQDITERKRAENAEREQRTLAEALRDTAETLNSTIEYGEVLDHILNTVGKVVPHDAASILLIDNGAAQVARTRGYEERGYHAEAIVSALSLDETANLKQMIETGQPVVVSDTNTYPGWERLPATEWLRSNVGAPISIHGEVVGFILLDSGTAGFFTSTHAERLKAFANQAALAIQNARLLKQAQDEISERRQAEEALRRSEALLREAQRIGHIGHAMWNSNSNELICSDELYDILEIPRNTPLTQQALAKMMLPEEQVRLTKLDQEAFSKQENLDYEYRVQLADGTERWLHQRGNIIYDDKGQPIQMLAVVQDITARKRAETELRISEERFRQLADNIQETFWMTDAVTGKELYISPAAEKIWGHSTTTLMTDPNAFFESIYPEDLPKVQQMLEVQRAGQPTSMEYRTLRQDGSICWVWDRAFPIFDETGKVVRLAGIAADITERKQAQDALRESENRYRGLFENLVIGFALHEIVTDEAGKPVDYIFLEINPMFEALTGIRARDAIGRRVTEVLPGVGNERFIQLYGKVALTGEPAHLEEFSSDLNRYFEINAYAPKHGQFAVTFIDITERKRTEAEAQRHLAELEALYENGLAVGRLLNTHEIGERIISTFSRYLSWHHVTIRLLQPGSEDLKLIAFNLPGLSEEERFNVEQHFQSVISKLGQGLSGWVAQTGEPLRTGNVHAHPPYIDTLAGIQSGLYMPLKIGERVLGVISVESEEPDAFTLQDERLLATLATQASVALENARLYQSIQQQHERFSDLFENSPVATWLEDFSAVVHWMNGLKARGITNLKEFLEKDHEAYRLGVRLIKVLDVNHAAVIMNGAHDKAELLEKVHDLMVDETPSQVIINELELIWRGYTSFGFEMSSQRLDGTLITGIQRIYIPVTNNEPDYARVIVTSTDITERVNFEQRLRASEVHYRELADSITDIFFELDQDLRFSHWNKASESLTGFTTDHAIGKSMFEMFGQSSGVDRLEQVFREVRENHQPKTFEVTLPLRSQSRTFEINAYPSTRGVAVVAKDVTERKLSESLMQKRFELMEYSAEHGIEESMQKVLDEISEWTHSAIGFFQTIQEDQLTPGVQVWSTDTFKHFHASQVEEMHKPADQAGVWAEAIRQRRAIIHNDYASLAGKKGMPESHAVLIREMIVPIIRNERIVAVIGIGNKSQDYTREDLEIMERFSDYAWDVIERKQMVTELAEERNQLAKRVEERTSDLSRANSNLARALRVKDEFLASMSHELRTPLNAILGLSESLGEQIAGPLNEKQQKYLNTISESGHHLLSLINDILDLAKIEAGQITLEINKVDVSMVSQASLRMIKQLAQKKNLEVSVEIDETLGLMWADERRLKQMIVNLLSNAVKFTSDGGKIGLQIQGNQEDNKVTITVWDTGIGIKEGDFQRLFQPFVQLDSGLAREATGTGLGLALVAQMARLHGGSVNVTSEPGKGSRFTIVLPWKPAQAMTIAEKMRVTGRLRTTKEENGQQTILLVEDTQEVVMMIKDYLEIAGYKVVTAQDGLDGITQAKLSRPNLILMDVQMPRMDGLEATQKLRQDPEFKHTPIIALTALAMPNDRERCIAAGMDEYISKPVNLRSLVRTIQSCLSIREEKTLPR